MTETMVGAFYNPHIGADLLSTELPIDHLAMADPPRADDPSWEGIRERYTLLLHDYLGQLSEPLAPRGVERARGLAEMYRTPWVAEHFQCLHTQDGRYNLNYVFPPLYTEEFLARFISNARALADQLDQPLVMENIPGFFEVRTDQMSEPEWLGRFFESTGCGFLLDLPHVWLEAHYREMDPVAWLKRFPLDRVVEVHVAGVEEDRDLKGPWIAPSEPDEAMLDFMVEAIALCEGVRAVTFDAFSPSLSADVLFRTVSRVRELIG
ncbi:MAG: multinuclear nonheme iron-dependent oxidase [Actinomycetota bacterium]